MHILAVTAARSSWSVMISIKKQFFLIFLSLILALTYSEIVRADVLQERYPVMRPDRETLRRWLKDYESAPKFSIKKTGISLPRQGSKSLLSFLHYTPCERYQGSCGNCWAWAGTAVMAIDLSVNESIADRLSVQYINSCKSGIYACCGGNLAGVETFYTNNPQSIPWANPNASYADAGRTCKSGSSFVSCGSISTSFNYPIVSISDLTITTTGVSQTSAIANIKAMLNSNKAVWFGFFLANNADWGTFYNFWDYNEETVLWDPDLYCGHTWVEDEGGGHAVLCVGYNDDDLDPAKHYWVILNSWGTAGAGRPNGLYRMKMDIDYECMISDPVEGDFYALLWQTLNINWGDVEPRPVALPFLPLLLLN